MLRKHKYIGSLRGWDYYPYGLSWIEKPMKVLGIVFTCTHNVNYKYNFECRIKNLKTLLDIWKQRSLSLKGKVAILNTLALPSLIYVSSVKDTPKRAIEEISKIINDFMWDGKKSKISRKTLIQDIEYGGLKLCDFETKVKSLKLSWVKRLTSNNNANWKILPTHFYGCSNMSLYFYANQDNIKISNKIPRFYIDIHNLWMYNFHNEPSNLQDILQESIWLNRYITSEGSPLYWKPWVDKNILKISDLVNHEGIFLSHQQISKKYSISCNFLQILQIRQSIPFSWRQMISNSYSTFNTYKPLPTLNIRCNQITKPLNKLSCKEIYWHMINKDNHIPASKSKWHQLFPLLSKDADNLWPEIYKLPFIITRETKLQSFQYKIIHRIISCNKWLYNIKIKDNSQCNYCECEDTIEHFSLLCENSHMFWSEWHNW